MDKSSIFKKIKKIEITTRRAVEDYFSGKYQSVFKGTGMNFSDVREYYPGDDVRRIDWNVTSRLGKPYVKEFIEERERTIMIAVDVSASGDFGSSGKSKTELACEIASVVAFSALKNRDKVGLVMFSDRIEKYLPPGKSSQHVMRIIREILCFERQNNGTDIEGALKFINDVRKKRSVVFLISDFIGENYEKSLRAVNRKHDLIAVGIRDSLEDALPDAGFVEIEDSESGEIFIADTGNIEFRRKYELFMAERDEAMRLSFGRAKVDFVSLNTSESYVKPLYAFFKMRERRRTR
ncbi:MAG: DUF58 domain-containing protein [bacterium]|nr:DUF58 domain-containing protein [bacterium]